MDPGTFWILYGVVAWVTGMVIGAVMQQQGRSYLGGFLIGFIFGPIFGFIIMGSVLSGLHPDGVRKVRDAPLDQLPPASPAPPTHQASTLPRDNLILVRRVAGTVRDTTLEPILTEAAVETLTLDQLQAVVDGVDALPRDDGEAYDLLEFVLVDIEKSGVVLDTDLGLAELEADRREINRDALSELHEVVDGTPLQDFLGPAASESLVLLPPAVLEAMTTSLREEGLAELDHLDGLLLAITAGRRVGWSRLMGIDFGLADARNARR